MEKILLAIDGLNIDMPTLDFACYLARQTGSNLTGVFLENLVVYDGPLLETVGSLTSFETEKDFNNLQFPSRRVIIERNIERFKDACEKRDTLYSIHRDRGVPASEIITESRYADLLIVDAETSFNKGFEGAPTQFVKEVLAESECPVIIAPESFEGIDEIIFTYDGSKSAAFAIKQFTYLLPHFDEKKVTVLQVNQKGEWEDTEKTNLRDWLQTRYSSIGFEALRGESIDQLFFHLFKKKNVFIVMGAYGRNAFSRFFKESHADLLIKTITQPIFISHY